MNYGLLLAALKPRDDDGICLVRGLQSTQSRNRFDGPALKVSHIIPHSIIAYYEECFSFTRVWSDMQVYPENH